MSKDTPEVGDVYLRDFSFGKFKSTIHTIENGVVYSISKNGYKIYVCVDNSRDFYKNYDYLGKSKANIDDLFKTENEK